MDELELNKIKFEAIDQLLEDEYVLVHLTPQTEGVSLPSHLMNRSSVTLKLSRLFRGGIELFTEKIVTDLLFDKSNYFTCVIPYSAVWGASSTDGSLLSWREDIPSTMTLPQAKSKAASSKGERGGASAKSSRPSHLRRVK